jgi:hypothetical protein
VIDQRGIGRPTESRRRFSTRPANMKAVNADREYLAGLPSVISTVGDAHTHQVITYDRCALRTSTVASRPRGIPCDNRAPASPALPSAEW